MSFRVSPGTYANIIDDSLDAVFTSPNIAAAVGGHTRGPLGPNLVTSLRNRKLRYGYNNPAWGHLIDSTDAFLGQGTRIFTDRVVSADAKYGLGLICNNTVGGQPMGSSYTSIPGGSYVPYDQINRMVVDVEASAPLVAGQSMVVTINGVSTPSVGFVVDHNTTMTVLEQAVQNVLDGIAPGGYAWIVPIGANDLVLRVVAPQAITLTMSATTNGGAHLTIYNADWLGFVVAQNPGSWSSPDNDGGYPGVAVGVTNVDVGVAQRVRIGFTQAILQGQEIVMVANGTTITTPFAVNNNQTLINFCSDYARAVPGGSASPVLTSTGSNHLQLQRVAPSADQSLQIQQLRVQAQPNYQFQGSAPSNAIATYVVTLQAVPSNGTFALVVYETNNFVQPDEFYLCTYASGTDGLGAPTGIDYKINGVDSRTNTRPLVSPSTRISIAVNPNFSGTMFGSTNPTNSNLDRYLGGGADGSIPSTQQIVTGWDDFANPEQITVRLLINAGYASPEVHQKMMAISARRQDCFSILDIPSNLQSPEDAANYRQNIMAVNSFWGAAYASDVLIYDQDLGCRRYVPPSGQVAAQYAYNDRVASAYFAPAGLTRGILANALGCRYVYEEGDRDALSQAQVNAIRFINGAWTIWGEYTLQYATSALSSVPVVRMIIEVVTEASTTVAYSTFEPNNPYTWHRVTSRLDGIIQPIQAAQGITDYRIQCDGKNNTPEVIQQRVMKIALWIKPVLCALYIQLDLIVTRQSANFDIEEVASANQY